MRIRIVFKLKNKGASVPFHHQYLLYKLINDVTREGADLYKHFQDYHYSGLKGQTKVSKNGLHFYSSKITLVLASADKDFLNFFLSKIFLEKEIQVGNLELVPENVEQEKTPLFGEAVKYICISPLVPVNPEYDNPYAKKFVSPEQDIFSDLVYESTISRMEKTGRFSSEQIASFFKFQIVPDKDYLKKIKEGDKKFARIYTAIDGKSKFELRGYTFPFVLYACQEVQEFIFFSGLGAYTHKGYGMVDLANTDPVERTVLYEPTFTNNY